jgi:O-antigen biosynthesis protein
MPAPSTCLESSGFHYSDIRSVIRGGWRPTVVEIGVHEGGHTRLLLNACLPRLGKVIGIDPAPAPSIARVMQLHPLGNMMKLTSLQALSLLVRRGMKVNIAVVDGDHNYYTVLNELLLIKELLSPGGTVFLHDVSWPYARRDLYYDPESIPAEARHPYAMAGMVNGQSELVAVGGANSHLFNALHEGGPKNGVLTALEDFVNGHADEWTFDIKPEYHGLGILRRIHRHPD